MAEMGWAAGPDGFVRTGSDGRGREGAEVGAPAVLGFSRAALPDQFPKRSATWPIGTAGTWILIGTVEGIGTDKGTIARDYGSSVGLIMRFNSTSQLELIYRRSDGVQLSLSHNFAGGLGSDRRFFAWGPDGGGGTDIELGGGGTTTTDNVALALADGTPAGTDAQTLDQAGTANRATRGTGLLFLAFSERLDNTTILTASVAELMALGSLQIAPQPGQALGEDVTTIVDSAGGGTWTPTDSTTAGTHDPMTVAEVTA